MFLNLYSRLNNSYLHAWDFPGSLGGERERFQQLKAFFYFMWCAVSLTYGPLTPFFLYLITPLPLSHFQALLCCPTVLRIDRISFSWGWGRMLSFWWCWVLVVVFSGTMFSRSAWAPPFPSWDLPHHHSYWQLFCEVWMSLSSQSLTS